MNPGLWLRAFLQSRGLKVADGRPLYAYRCTEEEYDLLRAVMLDHSRYFKPHSASKETAQLFCMVASEWWRRNHEAGAWKWEGILEETGFSEFPLNALYPWIQRGLLAWGRRLQLDQRGRLFLVTLACEGGLPLKLVRRENSALRRYFSHVMEEYGIFQEAGVRCHDLAERLSHFLPASLQNDVVFKLTGELVEEIWRLQEIVEDSSTPVIDLDRRQPGWRSRLPLEIDDSVARDLLKNLVNEAHSIKQTQPARLRFHRFLVPAQGQWHLKGELTLPKTLSPEQLTELIGVDRRDLPIRLQLLAATESGGRFLLAIISEQLGSNPKVYRLDSPPHGARSASGVAAAAERALFATVGQDVRGPLFFTGSQGLGELPWVFAPEEDGTARHTGIGSVSVRGPECIVALPEGFEPQTQGEASIESLGALSDPHRLLLRVTGSVDFLGLNGDRCRVSTGHASALTREYRLSGVCLNGVTSHGRPVFHGEPSLEAFEIPENSPPRRVASPRLEWRPREGGSSWLPVSDRAYGEVSLRASVNEAVVFHGSCAVVPKDLALELAPGSAMRRGSLILRGIGEADVGCSTNADSVSVAVRPGAGSCTIDLEASGPPPPSVQLRLRWSGGRRVDLEVPFPARGARFSSGQGRTCCVDEDVPVDRLAGLSAVGLAVDSRERFWVDGVLTAQDVPTSHNVSLWADLQPVGLGQHRLDLQSIQERARQLFAETSDLDATIRLRVESNRDGLRPLPIRASRFDLPVGRDLEAGHVILNTNGSQFPVQERLRLEALPLWEPASVREPLTEVGEGRWEFAPDSRTPGPWLILGWDGDWCRTRPLLWTVPGEIGPVELDALQLATCAGQETRPGEMAKVVQILIDDPLHPAWNTALSFLRLVGDIPPSILDFPAAMATRPETPITALMLASPQESLRIWHTFEELPFSWELVPAKAWIEVARRYRDSIRQTLGDIDGREQLADSSLDAFLQFARNKRGMVETIGECIRWVVLGVPRDQTQIGQILAAPPQLFPSAVESERQGVVHRSEVREWPRSSGWSDWLARHRSELPDELVSAYVEPAYRMSEFRRSVLEMPPLAAFAAAFNLRVDRRLLSELRRLRSFDQRWFDAAYEHTFRACVAYLVRNEPRLWQ